MKARSVLVASLGLAVLALPAVVLVVSLVRGGQQPEQNQAATQPTQAASAPVAFTSKEGKKGWKVVLPGKRPLATPAVVDGKVFCGGGFGSHEFYAFDAATGKTLWVYRTGDDGPTAAAVADGYIAFNTESCELEILALDGKRVWKKWLGDPLMSMPAIGNGKVYMAYPDSKNGGQHLLACFDLKSGQEHWKLKIAGDIITAPVLQGENVYLATLDGTLYCVKQGDGQLVWSEKKNITSSPAVFRDKCYFSQREVVVARNKDGKEVPQQHEQLAGRILAEPRAGTASGPAAVTALRDTARQADYLDLAKRQAMSPLEKANQGNDASVGFAAQPAAADLPQAQRNLGQATVCGVWAYQGSRPFVYKERIYSSMGDILKCVDPGTEKVVWKKSLAADQKHEHVDAFLTPPALVNGRVFVGTLNGEIICLDAATGTERWRATLGEPILFQPAVAHGRVYVSTNAGSLYCLDTGDPHDHGWLMWGGSAGHNGVAE